MRSNAILLCMAILAGCASAPKNPGDFSYLRTPQTFRSFAIRDNAYSTTYTAPVGWREGAARNSFVFWNAVMAVRTGNRCFALDDVKMYQREDIGSSGLAPGAPAGPTTPGAPLSTRPPVSYLEFTAVTRLLPDCNAPNAVDAQDYLSRTQRPELPPKS